MLKSVLSLWVLSLFLVSAMAQNNHNLRPEGFTSTAAISNSRNNAAAATSTTATGEGGSDPTSSTRGGAAAAITPSTADNAGQGQGGGGAGQTGVSSSGTIPPSGVVTASPTQEADGSLSNQSPAAVTASGAESSSNGGLSSTAKIGVGVGVGVGVVLIAGAVALFFILRRRRSNNHYRSSGASAAYLREQPAMASGAPALAGMSEMGRSPSRHSFPHTPSQHSLVTIPNPPPEPKVIPAPHHSLARSPSFHSEVASLRDRDSLMPTLPPYEDAPSPMEGNHHDEPVSPVSPISPAGSRPPSPLHDHER